MAPKIAIVFYSMYGHIRTLAEAEKRGIEKAGGTCDLYQVPETLPSDYDGFLMGIPTRFGNFPAQWKAFWDKTGGQWASGGFHGKFAGVFISTASPGGGQESTAIAAMSTLAHHGIMYVPLGYKNSFGQLTDMSEVRGGSPWGAGSFAAGDGSRQPSPKELEIAEIQGEQFYHVLNNGPEAASSGNNEKKAATAASAGNTASGAPQPDAEANMPKEKKSKGEGPCGLPKKCVVQ
ncbi:benzoquinone reductase [Apiospora saccharicola]